MGNFHLLDQRCEHSSYFSGTIAKIVRNLRFKVSKIFCEEQLILKFALRTRSNTQESAFLVLSNATTTFSNI